MQWTGWRATTQHIGDRVQYISDDDAQFILCLDLLSNAAFLDTGYLNLFCGLQYDVTLG